ncbi:hypothetical protein STRMOE7_02015 [Streptomyces sp. MOE7]|nr:hypothetical protein STRMOE7_02015 [Streptomyces sp. MOE7]
MLRETGDTLLLALTLTRMGSVVDDLAEEDRRQRQALALHAGISRNDARCPDHDENRGLSGLQPMVFLGAAGCGARCRGTVSARR